MEEKTRIHVHRIRMNKRDDMAVFIIEELIRASDFPKMGIPYQKGDIGALKLADSRGFDGPMKNYIIFNTGKSVYDEVMKKVRV